MRVPAAVTCLALLACKSAPAPAPDKPAAAPAPAAGPALPDTPREPTLETLHGVTINDDYRWLEDGKAPRVAAWSDAQNAVARAALDALPGVEILRTRIRGLITQRPPSVRNFIWRRGTNLFAVRSDPAHKQQPDLVVLDSLKPDANVRVLLDLMALDPTGATAMDWFVPSLDGSMVAVALSQRGSEDGTLHVYDVATGKETGDVIPRVQEGTGGGSVAWTGDGKGFFYTRYPREGERPRADLDFYQQVWFHALGTPESKDTYSLGKEFPRIAEVQLSSSEDGKLTLARVANGDGGDFSLWLRDAAGKWVQVSRDEDGVIDADFGRDGALWLLSKKGTPRRQVLRLPLATPVLARATVVVPQQQGVVEEVVPTGSRVYVVETLGGPTRIRVFDHKGKELTVNVPAPPVSTNAGVQRLDGDDVFFYSTSYTSPLSGYAYRAQGNTLEPTVVRSTPVADFSDAEVVEEVATSRDGTQVPFHILQPRGVARDGKNPTLVSGYGGYGVSMKPYYSDLAHVYLEQGVVQVQAILRGGGEFGEEWHDAGRLTRKQNVFDDFVAVAQRLVELGYTSPDHLAIEGGSNGGLLMGAAFTQHPELFRAVVSHVGIYDMIHVEDSPNGQFNVTEFGTVKDPAQFTALHAYSPYHHVTDGTAYPAILFLTGANDPRVDPMQSRKMTARLQAAHPRGRPVLLRTSAGTGHGQGSPIAEVIAQRVDTHAFVLHQLGVTVKDVSTPAAR
jgi:prolyl oligopeptidase